MSAYHSKLEQQSKMEARIDQIRSEERKKKKNRRIQNSDLSVPKEIIEKPEEALSRTQLLLEKARKQAPLLLMNSKNNSGDNEGD